jgi:DNA-binding MarR family transcriptional regulator
MNVAAEHERANERADVLARELMGITAGIRRTVRRHVSQSMPSQPLPQAQVDLLLVVEGQPGIGVAAAARSLHLAGNSVSALVNSLATAGLLKRETDQNDRRAAQLFLTPKATSRLARWRDARAGFVGAALDRIGPDDRQHIERALAPLNRLLDELRAQAGLS